MTVQIDKTRLDIERVRQEMRQAVPKALAGIAAGCAVAMGLILGVAHFLPSPPAPPPVIINLPAPAK